MATVPPRLPGQGKEPFSWLGLLIAVLIVGLVAIPAFGIAMMMMEIVYPGQW